MTKEILSCFYSLRLPCQLSLPPTHFPIFPSYPTDMQYKFTLVQYIAFCSPKNCVDLGFSGTNRNRSEKGNFYVFSIPPLEEFWCSPLMSPLLQKECYIFLEILKGLYSKISDKLVLVSITLLLRLTLFLQHLKFLNKFPFILALLTEWFLVTHL